MARLRAPLFLRPAHYRLRRRRDAARLLPVLGGFLFLLPILWAPARSFDRDTAPDGIFLFVAWGGLILLAFIIARSLANPESAEGADADSGFEEDNDADLDPEPGDGK
jgi:hypothetical protein